MAAAVLDFVAVPRPYTVSSSSSSSHLTAMVLASPATSGYTARLSSKFTGLRISGCRSMEASVVGRTMAARLGVLCEAQKTVNVPDVSKATWQSLVLDSNTAVLVEFWAPWCGPCRMVHPIISELSKDYAGKMKCYKLNTDENPDIATRYGIRSIPTTIVFKRGEKKEAIIGSVPKSTLTACIDKFV